MLTRLATLAVLATLALAPSALAQGSAETTYAGPGGNLNELDRGAAPTADDQGGGDGLPFTGLDLALALGGGLILVGTGVGISRLVARDEPA